MTDLDPERWQRFVTYLGRARAKPTFDAEEREPKRPLARRFREALEPVRPTELPARIERLEMTVKNRLGVLRRDDFEWLRAWAAADPASLADALAPFTAEGLDAQRRFEGWADACTRAAVPGHTASDADAALAVGSLFNFALEPVRLPILSEALFGRLESDLGHEREADLSLPARYRSHLRFAELVQRRLVGEGFPVRDMIDVQSLIFLAAQERDFWAVDAPAGPQPEPVPGQAYLAVCAIYRNEAPYLPEWIEFHRAVGVERFFLYDNRSDDSHMQVLAPYLEAGTVVLHDWPSFPGQIEAYDHCLAEHGTDSRWIAFLDADEFLFSPLLKPLTELLPAYEGSPAVGVNRVTFGTSGHRTRPPGLVIENYLRRGPGNRFIKSIVQPAWAARCVSAHRFEYRQGLTVDENGYPIHRDATKSVSMERLRINHYFTRSEEELRAKHESLRADYGQARPGTWEESARRYDEEHDELITAYAPQVRAALSATRSRAR